MKFSYFSRLFFSALTVCAVGDIKPAAAAAGVEQSNLGISEKFKQVLTSATDINCTQLQEALSELMLNVSRSLQTDSIKKEKLSFLQKFVMEVTSNQYSIEANDLCSVYVENSYDKSIPPKLISAECQITMYKNSSSSKQPICVLQILMNRLNGRLRIRFKELSLSDPRVKEGTKVFISTPAQTVPVVPANLQQPSSFTSFFKKPTVKIASLAVACAVFGYLIYKKFAKN